MLVEFKIKNFLSFKDETTLNMIPSVLSNNKVAVIKDVKLLKSSVIFGSNGSGKSNLIRAIKAAKDIILDNNLKKYRYDFFRLDNKSKYEETIFHFKYFINDTFYMYHLEVSLYNSEILKETLSILNPKTDKFNLIFNFSSSLSNEFSNVFNRNLKLLAFDKKRLETYLFDKANYKDKSLISCLINKTWDNENLGFITDFKEWFNSLNIISSFNNKTENIYYKSKDDINKITKIINKFDVRIKDIELVEIPFRKFLSNNPNFDFEIFNKLEEKPKDIVLVIISDDYYEFSYQNNELVVHTIKIKHNNTEEMFSYKNESDGTKRLFDLLNMIINTNNDNIFIIDELDRSLHPLLTYKLLEVLNYEFNHKNIQLIFSTHESYVLDFKLFRNDEIWFVEKDKFGRSKMYSLDIFKVRREKIIKDGYLSGEYGAVPVFDHEK